MTAPPGRDEPLWPGHGPVTRNGRPGRGFPGEEEKTSRNVDIHRRYSDGESIRGLALAYDLDPKRIRQILDKFEAREPALLKVKEPSPPRRKSATSTCKRCRSGGLTWVNTKVGWRLGFDYLGDELLPEMRSSDVWRDLDGSFFRRHACEGRASSTKAWDLGKA